MAKLLLKDGTKIPVSLTYRNLYDLEKNKPELAKEYFEATHKKELNELDMVKVIYVGYICAGNPNISFEDFLEKLPTNRNTVISVYYELLYPKN